MLDIVESLVGRCLHYSQKCDFLHYKHTARIKAARCPRNGAQMRDEILLYDITQSSAAAAGPEVAFKAWMT